MDFSKLRTGDLIAAVCGVLLLIVMFFAWYGGEGAEAGAETWNAWEAFGFIDLLLFLTAMIAIGAAVLAASGRSIALPIAASVIVTILGIVVTLLVLYRLINEPGGVTVFGTEINIPDKLIDIKIGAYLGFLLCIGIAVGGFLSMAEEGTTPGAAPQGQVQPPPAAPAGAPGSTPEQPAPPPLSAPEPPPEGEPPRQP
jgi:hypothetical protein